TRFRLRIFTKNWMRFLTLFIGIMFGSLLLVFGFCLLPTMDYNADQMSENLLAEHIYILKTPVEIDVTEDERAAYAAAERLTFEETDSFAPAELMSLMQKAAAVDADAYMKNTLFNSKEVIQGAEKIATTSLLIDKPRSNTAEEITVYGIEETSKYKDIEIAHNKVVAGLGFVEKLGIQVEERITLYNKMSGDEYSFVIDGTTGNKNDMNIYISRSYYNTVFDNDETWFNGYISNDPLNITKHYVATEITPASMKRISEQMHDSMGNMIYLLVLVSLPIYFVLIYLLTKIVIDKNARYISYMKVFGYRNSEINTLYIRSISATVIASLIISIPVLIVLVKWIIGIAMYNYSGNFVVSTPLNELLKVALLGIVTYAVVAFFHIRAIKRIPLSLAMKTYE
ncbi:MAG: ABC transporter permease, partial [Eggerthellaceae bacterium]|nr:ABC transporter permease [Eggerthellaceae bacterium]